MVAHSQFCESGDNTIRAISRAVKNITEADKSLSSDISDGVKPDR
jgi:hypothetical protein